MEPVEVIYSDNYFSIMQNMEYPHVPGFFVIKGKRPDSFFCNESITRLAILEKEIRDGLLSVGAELVGIYREEMEDGSLQVLMIPYYVEKLIQNDISPDLYQPYIQRYLKSFSEFHLEKTNELKQIMKKRLETRM